MGKEGMKDFDHLNCPLEGVNLIEASAGTGKTSTIEALYLRLLLEKGYLVDEILVVTYTVPATEELRDRIRRKVRAALDAMAIGKSEDSFLARLLAHLENSPEAKERLQQALYDFDRASIFTIHGFCQRLLHERAFEAGSLFDMELHPEEDALLKEEIVCDFWRQTFYPAPWEVVSYALARKKDLRFFLQTADHLRGHLEFEILGPSARDHLPSLRPFQESMSALAESWPRVKEEVRRLLGGGALNARKYPSGDLLIQFMDDFLGNPGPKFPLPEDFLKFTAGEIQGAVKKNQKVPRHEFFDLVEKTWFQGESLMKEMEDYFLWLKVRLLEFLSKELPRRKERRTVQSFDDLLIRVRRALEGEGGEELSQTVRSRYRAALVDEFQDTDPTQYAIFQHLFGKPGSLLFLIGDPKQAIYSFRGADLFAYLKAAAQVQNRYTLRKNWRAGPELVRAVNTIFSNARVPFLYDHIQFQPVESGKDSSGDELREDGEADAPLLLWWFGGGKNGTDEGFGSKREASQWIAQAVAAEVTRLVQGGREGRIRIGSRPLQEEDIAILVRTNEQGRIIQQALQTFAVPSILHGMGNLFDTHEALEMSRLLAAVAEPQNENRLRAALATDLLGVTGEEIDRLLGDETRWEEWLFRFAEYFETWETKGFIPMFHDLLRREGVRRRLLALPDGERRLTNVLHLVEVLSQQALDQKLGRSALCQWLFRQIDRKPLRLEEHLLRLESDARAVKIVTIHKSKGLEYPVVFCPFNWWEISDRREKEKDFFFHDPWDEGKLKLVLGAEGDGKWAWARKEFLAEDLRLLYVSLTRAKNRCYLIWGRFKNAEGSALAYILHPPLEGKDDVVEATRQHFQSLSAEAIGQDLERLVYRSEGSIRLSEPPSILPGPLSPMEGDRRPLRPPPAPPSIPRDWGIPSFSSWIAQRREGAEEFRLADLPDYDLEVFPAERVEREEPEGIFAFPKGVKAGSFFHAVFQHIDYASPEAPANQEIVREKFHEYGMEARWEGVIGEMIGRVLRVPLQGPKGSFSLSQIDPSRRVNELEFHFPLKAISPKRLAEIFSAHGKAMQLEGFSGIIESLQFQPLQGFMKGFIDLIFEHQGQFFLVDWKSNYLGPRVEDYGPEALRREMEEKLYFLQSHLYVLALQQYLRWRLPRYSYERDFGGVFYVFLRGVDPRRGSQYGIYGHRPPKELLLALEENLIPGSTSGETHGGRGIGMDGH
jgi:exodeoxyribonuclease V beta subunit